MAVRATQRTHIAGNKADDHGRFGASLGGDRIRGRIPIRNFIEHNTVERDKIEGVCFIRDINVFL